MIIRDEPKTAVAGVTLARQPDQEQKMRNLPGAPPDWQVEVHDYLLEESRGDRPS